MPVRGAARGELPPSLRDDVARLVPKPGRALDSAVARSAWQRPRYGASTWRRRGSASNEIIFSCTMCWRPTSTHGAATACRCDRGGRLSPQLAIVDTARTQFALQRSSATSPGRDAVPPSRLGRLRRACSPLRHAERNPLQGCGGLLLRGQRTHLGGCREPVSHRTRQFTPRASFSASAMTSEFRCSTTAWPAARNSWVSTKCCPPRANSRARQHHLGGAAALAHFVAHRRPHGPHRGRVELTRGGGRLGHGWRGRIGRGRLGAGLGNRLGRCGSRPATGSAGAGAGAGAAAGAVAGAGIDISSRVSIPLDALQQSRLGVAGRGQQQSCADHLEQQTWRRRTAHSPNPACTTSAYRVRVAGRVGPLVRASGPARPPAHPQRLWLPRRGPLAAR